MVFMSCYKLKPNMISSKASISPILAARAEKNSSFQMIDGKNNHPLLTALYVHTVMNGGVYKCKNRFTSFWSIIFFHIYHKLWYECV